MSKKSKMERIAEVSASLINQKIINEAGDPPVFMVTSLCKTNIKLASGWRMKPVNAGQEMFLKNVRPSGRDFKLIYEFEPADAVAVEQIDFPANKVEEAISGFGRMMKEHIGFNEFEEDTPWPDFLKALAKIEIERMDEEERRLEEEKKRQNEELYADNPIWGMF